MRGLALLGTTILGFSLLIASVLDVRAQQIFGRAEQQAAEPPHHVRGWSHP